MVAKCDDSITIDGSLPVIEEMVGYGSAVLGVSKLTAVDLNEFTFV